MPATEQKMTLSQACDKRITVHVTGTNPAAALAIKWAMFDAGGRLLISKSLSSGGIGGAAAAEGDVPGSFEIYLFSSDTAALAPGTYFHEARILDADSQQDVVSTGTVVLLKSITAAI